MSKSWSRDWAYCTATNRDGTKCGNKIPTLPSGVYVRGSLCRVHAKVSRRGPLSKDTG